MAYCETGSAQAPGIRTGGDSQLSLEHPEQRHRELWYNLAREGKVHVSLSSVYRVLKSEDLVPPHSFGKPHREKVKPDPKKPHEDWMVDGRLFGRLVNT